MIEALPIKDLTEPLIIKGNEYYVEGTGTNDEGVLCDKIRSARTGMLKEFPREVLLKSIDNKNVNKKTSNKNVIIKNNNLSLGL